MLGRLKLSGAVGLLRMIRHLEVEGDEVQPQGRVVAPQAAQNEAEAFKTQAKSIKMHGNDGNP